MDDIYDELENYNDVNVIEELRNENKELKFKVEEYTLAIEKLQKEFDKVSMDFKMLEVNYSSLLRTAKAEIERKTQAIASLNTEKDMLVINSIQNTNKTILVLRGNIARERSNNRKSRKDEVDSVKTNKKDVQEIKKHELERVRNDENRLPSIDTVLSGNTGDSNKIIKTENKSTKLDIYDKSNESKEIVAKAKKALNLKHRRKSMPILNKQVKFSSDEEDDYCSDDVKRERFSREEKSRKYFNRHKISETSGIDEKYSSYHESSRETYYKGNSHRPMDKYRSIRDKSRLGKHFSPEKVRRPTRDYHEDERQELFRHNRVLVSPPRERINPLRMFRDRRSNYERDRSLEERHPRRDDFDDRMRKDRGFLEDRHKQRDDYGQGRYPQKYGLHEEGQRSRSRSVEFPFRHRGTSHDEILRHKSDVFDEKRKSRDSSFDGRHKQKDKASNERDDLLQENQKETISSNHTAIEERKSRRRERQSDDDEPSSKRSRKDSCKTIEEVARCHEEPRMAQEKLLPEFAAHLQYTSCQSPDDPHHDTQLSPFVPSFTQPKEIMTTSSSYVEDPRLISKKYVKSITRDNKIVLETITGRNVDLIAIDTSKWSIPQVEVPPSLGKPPEFSDEMVQEVYMDIDNPTLNTSLELGEIQSESNDGRMADYLSKNFYQDYENERIKQIEARADKEIANLKHKRDAIIKQDPHKKESIDVGQNKKLYSDPKLPPVKYKIPRTSISEPEKENAPKPFDILFQQMRSVCSVDPPTKPPVTKLDVDATFGTDDESQDKNAEDKVDKPKEECQLRGRTISAQELVEGDLALSDETTDNVFMQRQKRKQKLKEKASTVCKTEKKQKTVLDIEQKTTKPGAKLQEKKPRKSKTSISDQKVEDCKTNITESPSDDLSSLSMKKTRKKPSPKQKPTSAKEIAKTVDTKKNTKVKKSKSPKDIKEHNQGNKFTELFGDSSSLMTPEDLGMVTEVHTAITKKYIPIFEDAQDAVDVNVTAMKRNEIEMVQPSVTCAKIDEPTSVIQEKPKSIVCKINLRNRSVTQIDQKETNKDSASVKKITPNIEVSNEEASKEPDVVKTVIISTGAQPRIDVDTKIIVPDKSEDISKTAEREVLEPAIPIALATSTPHKRLLLQLEAQVECNSSCSSNEVQKDTTPVEQSSTPNGLSSDTQNDDKPDLRIFMKRRRRLKK